MIRLDHVLNAILPHYEAVLHWFVKEQKTGKYRKFKDNPNYEEVKALIDCMNVLRKYLGWKKMTLKEEVETYLLFEKI